MDGAAGGHRVGPPVGVKSPGQAVGVEHVDGAAGGHRLGPPVSAWERHLFGPFLGWQNRKDHGHRARSLGPGLWRALALAAPTKDRILPIGGRVSKFRTLRNSRTLGSDVVWEWRDGAFHVRRVAQL